MDTTKVTPNTVMNARVKELFEESIAIKSFTNSALEQDIEKFLIKKISHIPYFAKHSDLYGECKFDDFHQRSIVWALKKGNNKETIILFHHHDVVDTTDYGKFENIAFDNEKIKQAYLQEQDFSQDIKTDASSGEWYFARGSADMKAALALQLAVLEEYCKQENPRVNVLYLSVPDEESYSAGMRGATKLLSELMLKHNLEYRLAIDSEPFESDNAKEKLLHIGTVGKLMPVIVAQGVLTHIKEPLEGLNSISLLSKITDKIDLNPLLADSSKGEHSPLPSWGYMRDRKEVYDASTVLRAAGYFSILYLEKSPEDLITTVRDLAQEATDEYYEKWFALQKQFDVSAAIKRPVVMFYDELLEKCRNRVGFDEFFTALNECASKDLLTGETFQNIAIKNIEKLLDFYGKKEAIIVVALAPPYYPALSSTEIQAKGSIIPKVTKHYADYLKNQALALKSEEYFMGICDISYCGLDKDVAVHYSVQNKIAVDKNLYNIDFDEIAQINVPGINLGPWGKDLHRYGERVYERDAFVLIPNYLLYLLENIDEVF